MSHSREIFAVEPAQMALLESAVPTYWPQVWREFAAVFFAGLVRTNDRGAPLQELAQVALEQVRTLCLQMGGQQIYLPKGINVAATEVASAICREFDGRNYKELAAKHDLSQARVRQIINESQGGKKPRNPVTDAPNSKISTKGAASPFAGL